MNDNDNMTRKNLEIKTVKHATNEDFLKHAQPLVDECANEIEYFAMTLRENEFHPLIEEMILAMKNESDKKDIENEYREVVSMAESNHQNAIDTEDKTMKIIRILINYKMWSDYIEVNLKEYIKHLITNGKKQ